MIRYRRKSKAKKPTQAELRHEHAAPSMGSIRDPWGDGSVVAGLTPVRLAGLLRASERGDMKAYLTLAMEMEERDPHYASVLSTRKRALEGIGLSLEAASDDARDVKIADAVREHVLDKPEFIDAISGALDGLGKGFSAVELIWQTGQLWRPTAYIWRDPRWFRFCDDDATTLKLITESEPLGEDLKPYKWLVHKPRLKMGPPVRGGLARLVAWSFLFKNYGQKDWMSFCETYGLPLRVGKFGPEATEDDKHALLRAVMGIGSDAAAVIPANMQIDFTQAANTSAGAQLFERLADWLDRQVSKAVLGQTMTADSGSSRSQAEVHDGVRQDILESDARALERSINAQIIRPFVDLNFGADASAPKVKFNTEPDEDVAAFVDNITKVIDRGLPVRTDEVYTKLGLTPPEKGEAVLHPVGHALPEAPIAANKIQGHCGHTHIALNRSDPDQDDSVDEMVEDFLEDWEPLENALIKEIIALAERGETAEAFSQGLADLAGGDAATLTDALAEALFAARALGDARDN